MFQWYRDDEPIEGQFAKQPVLHIAKVEEEVSHVHRCSRVGTSRACVLHSVLTVDCVGVTVVQHVGIYKCVVSNAIGSVETQAFNIVLQPAIPTIEVCTGDHEATAGDVVQFSVKGR